MGCEVEWNPGLQNQWLEGEREDEGLNTAITRVDDRARLLTQPKWRVFSLLV